MTAVVVNPQAGGGRAGTRFARLLRQRPLVPAEAVFVPESLPQLHTLARRLAEQGWQRLVVVGGDGTLHRVVNALYQAGALSSVTVGLVPAGTGSDLARALGLPRSLETCWQLALTTPPRPLDAGLITVGSEEVVFANVASAGLSGLVDERVNADPGRGALAFLRATLAAVKAFRPQPCRVWVDGTELFSGEALLVAVANGCCFGKGMRIAPFARTDDGLLEVVAVEAVAGKELLRRLPRVYLGRHMTLPQVRWARGREVRLDPAGPLPPLDVDGECYPSGPLRARVLAGAWQVAAPAVSPDHAG